MNAQLKGLAQQIRSGSAPHKPSEGQEPDDPTAVAELYEGLVSGQLEPQQALEELTWRGYKAYGAVVAERSGPVFFYERQKQRAALAHGIDPHPPSSKAKAQGERQYHPGTVELVRKAIDILPQLDADGDGVVNRAEARKLLTSYGELGLSAAQAASVYSQQDLVDVLDPGWPSQEKLTAADLKALLPENKGQAPEERVHDIMTQLSIRLSNQERLGTVPEVPLHLTGDGPNPLKVGQGSEGSCWFLGVLPTLCSDELKGLLVARDGHFEMRLPDGTLEVVTPLNEAERRVYSKGDGAWSGLLEKGVSQLLARTGDDITGGYAKDGLKLLTGAEAVGVSIMDAPTVAGEPDLRDRQQLAKLLEATMKFGGAIFTHAFNEDFDADLSSISGRNHAYTVTAFDPEKAAVKLRNPWGNGEKADRDGVNDGNFEMSLTEFAAHYSYMYVQRLP